MEAPHERTPVQHRTRVGTCADEIEQADRDLVVDALGKRRLELRVDADVGDDQALERRGLQMFGEVGCVLDREALKRRATIEDRFDAAGKILLDVCPGAEAAELDEFHDRLVASYGPAGRAPREGLKPCKSCYLAQRPDETP